MDKYETEKHIVIVEGTWCEISRKDGGGVIASGTVTEGRTAKQIAEENNIW